MGPDVSILKALADKRLFAGAFKEPATWAAWWAFLAALFGLAMSEDAAAIYRDCTGRDGLPDAAFREGWLICGRRSGKSRIMALIAVFLACLRDYRDYLGPGERATIMIIAADRKQARQIMGYVRGLLATPALAALVENDLAESIELAREVTIEVGTASHRAVRGYTIAACLGDELAVWPDEESASPDTEILAAIRPAMLTIPNALLICASSPYARRNALWEVFKSYYGKDDKRVLVWRAPTLTMNPTVPAHEIEDAYERDPVSAAAEYGAEFRTDIESFVDREAVEACISERVLERPPLSAIRYIAAVDPAGGSGTDSFTCAVAHAEKDGEGSVVVLDALRELRPPFSPESAIADIVKLLKTYGISTVCGDRWGGEFPREAFRKLGIEYLVSDRTKSDYYKDLLPLINSRRIDLLDQKRLIAQLCGLERRTARGGRDSIDHAPSAHDDVINSTAIAIVRASGVIRDPNAFDIETYIKAYS